MSPYILLYLFVAVCALISFNRRLESYAYVAAFFVATVILALRYGQGTDWLSYNYIFASAPVSIDFDSVFYTDAYHSEFGWKLLNNLWKAAGQDFVSLSVVCSLIEMYLLNRFLCRYSPNRSASLMVTLPVIYLTYFFSAFRQGLVIAIFLGILIPLLERRKYLSFVIVALVASCFHSASLLFIFVPLVMHFKKRQLGLLVVFSVCLGICMTVFLDRIMSMVGISYETSGVSWVAFLYRLIMLLIVYLLYSGKENVTATHEMLLIIYVFGFCVYVLFSCNQLLCSRLAAPFLALEAVLIPIFVQGQSKQGILIFMCVLVLGSIMYGKNISSSIEQGSYPQGMTIMEYPYISMLNKKDLFVYSHSKYLIYLA